MSSDPSPPFRLSYPGPVHQQLRRWAERAASLGLGEEFLETLRVHVRNLQSDPEAWGDPISHLPFRGSPVFHRGHAMLFVTYAVDLENRVVFIRGFRLMPNSPLEEPAS